MPNHITNVLTVEGEGAKEVVDKLFDKEGNITFDDFAPMPEELRGTTSPCKVGTAKEIWEAKKVREDYILNRKREIDAQLLRGEITEEQAEKRKESAGHYAPSVPITKEEQAELLSKYGHDNWYTWANANWGTKWGGYDGYRNGDEVCTFDSAWATPFSAMVKFSMKYPDVKIIIKYADEDFGYNVGEYTLMGGLVIDEFAPKGGTKEAIEMAMDVKNDSYYTEDYFADYFGEGERDEEDYDEFAETIVEIIARKEILKDNYPLFILEKLEEVAVANEQFEYAQVIQNGIKFKKSLEVKE